MRPTTVFFRNDDVNRMEPGLVEVTAVLNSRGISVSHAVEPANLMPEARAWLLEKSGRGVEIIQHGFAHVRYDVGEFGGIRSAADQEQDLCRGLAIMQDAFGSEFFPAMSFPFGSYNRFSIPLLDHLGYEVVSCHWRHQWSRQVYYRLGRGLRKGLWLGRHVSHHLHYYPGTNVREVSVTMAPIARYLEDVSPTACEFKSLPELQEIFGICRRLSPVVGVVLHHRYRARPEALDGLEAFVSWLVDQPGVTFADMREIEHSLSQQGA